MIGLRVRSDFFLGRNVTAVRLESVCICVCVLVVYEVMLLCGPIRSSPQNHSQGHGMSQRSLLRIITSKVSIRSYKTACNSSIMSYHMQIYQSLRLKYFAFC